MHEALDLIPSTLPLEKISSIKRGKEEKYFCYLIVGWKLP
jgi:hypothetical protein